MRSSSNDSKRSDTDTSSDFSRSKFKFPPAPRLCRSANSTSRSVSCNSDSSASDSNLLQARRRTRRRHPKSLPPIGVFWDIENCHVPKNKSASSIVQKVREIFFDGYREAEFIVVCDVKKENAQIIQDLHDAQVNLIHVSSTSKNAADEKLRQSMRRFAEIHSAPSAVVLISGDINFAGDLSDLRYRKKIHVILVHNSNAADALILCANETYTYASLTENLPLLKAKLTSQYEILIENLPIKHDMKKLRNRLKFLSDNCGGKVINIDIKQGSAVLRFSNYDFAIRAQRRLKGEDVFGYKIRISNPTNVRESPAPSFTARQPKTVDSSAAQSSSGYGNQDGSNSFSSSQNGSRDSWRYMQDQPYIPHENLFVPIRPNDQSDGFSATKLRSQFGYGDLRSVTPKDDPMGACGVSYPNKSMRSNSSFMSEDEEKAYQSFKTSISSQGSEPIELIISNLDPLLDMKELKKVLTNLLKEYVMVLSLNITTFKDGSPIAIVKLSSQQEAQYTISQLHHYKLGSKRITISYPQNNILDPVHLREMVIALLQEVPGNRMPLFKLIELLETRCHINVPVSEVSKLKDITRIVDYDHGGRIISLTPEVRTSPSGGLYTASMPYCPIHCPNGVENRGWGEAELVSLPNVNMSLSMFSSKLYTLLSSHMDLLPLISFPVCYQAAFEEPLFEDEHGVPLEHLVTCVNGVELKFGGPNRNIKYVTREIDGSQFYPEKEEASLKGAPAINSNVQLLCRELVDLLRTTERCQLPFSKFIPAYHHHFGRQCRVADYGYVKLIDLLQSQAISKVVQILGDGTRRMITLTHTAQVRRFTSDLLKILKGQQAKQIALCEFSAAYERVMCKPFNPFEYGLCQLEDLLNEVPENVIVISTKSPDRGITISIPKREQTAEEVVRTKQFAEDVVKLLYHAPQCSMAFNKFVPAYHHHFGLQCKVSDYGFTKLIELFEAISDTVKVEELPDGERKVCLTTPKALKVLGSQIRDIIKSSKLASLPLEALCGTYLREYGYSLCPQTYECETVDELISILGDFIKISQSSAGPLLVLMDSELNSTISMRVWALLLYPPHILSVIVLITQYRNRFQSNLLLAKLEELKDVVTIVNDTEQLVKLTPFYILATQFYHILLKAGGQVSYGSLESMYRRAYEKNICYTDFDMKGIEDLINRMHFVFVIRCSKKRTNIILNPQLSEYGIPLPSSSTNDSTSFKKEESASAWPPPPAHDLLLGKFRKRITPPKPDTPPAVSAAPWNSWASPTNSPDLFIPMPAFRSPKLMSNSDSLISPTRSLLPPHSLAFVLSTITAPHPAEVPMPDKLLGKDDSNDSGVINNSNMNSENEMDSSSEQQTGTKPKFGSSANKSYLAYGT